MSETYKVVGPCAVAGVAPGGTVTREQVEAFAGPNSVVQFGALVGTHLEPVQDEPPVQEQVEAPPVVKAESRKPAK